MALREMTKKPDSQSTTETEHTDTASYPYEYVQCTPSIHQPPHGALKENPSYITSSQFKLETNAPSLYDLPFEQPKEKTKKHVKFGLQENPSYSAQNTLTGGMRKKFASEKQQIYVPKLSPSKTKDSIREKHHRDYPSEKPTLLKPTVAATSTTEELYDDTVSVIGQTQSHVYQNYKECFYETINDSDDEDRDKPPLPPRPSKFSSLVRSHSQDILRLDGDTRQTEVHRHHHFRPLSKLHGYVYKVNVKRRGVKAFQCLL